MAMPFPGAPVCFLPILFGGRAGSQVAGETDGDLTWASEKRKTAAHPWWLSCLGCGFLGFFGIKKQLKYTNYQNQNPLCPKC